MEVICRIVQIKLSPGNLSGIHAANCMIVQIA